VAGDAEPLVADFRCELWFRQRLWRRDGSGADVRKHELGRHVFEMLAASYAAYYIGYALPQSTGGADSSNRTNNT
jgi:hypothetical protein